MSMVQALSDPVYYKPTSSFVQMFLEHISNLEM